jgi:hypothetical protein
MRALATIALSCLLAAAGCAGKSDRGRSVERATEPAQQAEAVATASSTTANAGGASTSASLATQSGPFVAKMYATPSMAPVDGVVRGFAIDPSALEPTCTGADAGEGFVAAAIATETGRFTATFEATPSIDAIDAVFGLSSAAATRFTDLAAIVRFNPAGFVDVRNGGGYAAAVRYPFRGGATYHVAMYVDVASHAYSVSVTGPGEASPTFVATNYAFRREQASASQLSSRAAEVDSATGTLTVSNFALPPPPNVMWRASLASGTYAAAMTNGDVVVSGTGGTTELDVDGVVVRQATWGGRIAADRANDVFVATDSGTLTEYNAGWTPAWTATRSDALLAVAADGEGGPVVVGSSGAVTRFDLAGHERWSVSVPGAVSAAMDDAGDVFVLANDSGTVVALKLSDAGDTQWTKRYAGDGRQSGRYIVADGAGDVIFTGLWGGTIDFGGGPMYFPGCCEGQSLQGFLVGLDVSGAFLYETSHDRYFIGGLTVDPDGNAAVGGEFSDSPRSPEFSVFDRGGHLGWGGRSYGGNGAGLGTLTSLAADAQGAVVEVVSTDPGSQVTKFAR